MQADTHTLFEYPLGKPLEAKLLKKELYQVQRGLRRGGLKPALAPRMPVMTEDAGKSSP